MSIVDDPMLALIMRFISKEKHLDISDEEFLQRQLTAIKDYVGQYPQEQETKKTMEWIEQYAENYRRDWQKNMAARQSSIRRCPDCPLKDNGYSSYCEIHNQWQDLLQNYIGNNINSKKYVEDTLRLLEEHKADLKVSLSSKGRQIRKHALEGGC